MRFLFVAKHHVQLRPFESTLAALLERGHRVHVGLSRAHKRGVSESPILESLAERHDALSWDVIPPVVKSPTERLRRDLRLAADALSYLDPWYDDAPALRDRALARAPAWAIDTAGRWPWNARRGAGRLRACLEELDRAIEPYAPWVDYVRDQAADALLVTPYVDFGTPQADLVRAAHAQGMATMLLVKSWDNLSSQGRIRDDFDRVLVWNKLQRREAVRLHGVSRERVTVTGAPGFDQWFAGEPQLTRARLAERVGLDPDRPYLLWVASSGAVGDEATFTRRWIEAVRRHPALRDHGILVRPHPQAVLTDQWDGVATMDRVAVHPPLGAEPVTGETKDEYLATLTHADAVVGVNTSAMLEAAIAGRPVLSVLDPQFADWQDATPHFRYLRDAGSGLLTTARSLGEHLEQLAGVVAAAGVDHDDALRRLVRPAGLDQPATKRVVRAVEEAAARGPLIPAPIPTAPRDVVGARLQRLLADYDRMPPRAGAVSGD